MSTDSQFEAEEQDICDRLNNGDINQTEFNNEMRELNREYKAMAEVACQEAYDNEAQNWH